MLVPTETLLHTFQFCGERVKLEINDILPFFIRLQFLCGLSDMCDVRNKSAIFPDKPSIQWSIDWQYVIKEGVN